MLSVPGITWMLYTWKSVKFYFKQEVLKWWWHCCGGDHRGAVVRYSPGQTLCLVGYWVGVEVLVGFTWQALPYKQFACMYWERGQCVWWVHVGLPVPQAGMPHWACVGITGVCVCVFLNVRVWYVLVCIIICSYILLPTTYTCWFIVCSLQLYTYIRSAVVCEVLPHHSNNMHSTLV